LLSFVADPLGAEFFGADFFDSESLTIFAVGSSPAGIAADLFFFLPILTLLDGLD
jgi:hypothetical protein